jgi:arylsulfatase A-like enzyme
VRPSRYTLGMPRRLERRECVQWVGAGAAALAAGAGVAPRTNIIYILADDLGYGELACSGQKKIHTPAIDRLAAEGIRVARHYSGSPVCAPSRCCLVTGLHGGPAYIRDNGPTFPTGGADTVFFDSAGGLRGMKQDLYDGGIRVPFIARWPGHTPPGAVSDGVGVVPAQEARSREWPASR